MKKLNKLKSGCQDAGSQKDIEKKIEELRNFVTEKTVERNHLNLLISEKIQEIVSLKLLPFKVGEDVIYNPFSKSKYSGKKCMIDIRDDTVIVIPYKNDGTLSKNYVYVLLDKQQTYSDVFTRIGE